MERIKVAIVGVGNCASALMQGIAYYRAQRPESAVGLMHWEVGGYCAGDIDVVAAYDIDARKVGRDVAEAIFAAPNCAQVFHPQVPATGATVEMGPVLDGFAGHMVDYPEARRCVVADAPEPDMDAVCEHLRESGAEILLNYLPVGSEAATRFYAECALRAGVGFINMMPVFIASDPEWAARFESAGLPIIGDDIKSQIGATIVHRALAELFEQRGAELDRTYQINTGGNTDFLNMLDRGRLESKRISKTEAVHALASHLEPDAIHVGPSDYVAWQGDNKVAFIRMEARIFGDVPVNMELRLSVEDSPNSAGVAIDAIRCCKLGLMRGLAGVLDAPASYFCKHPPQQTSDEDAYRRTEAFIDARWREGKRGGSPDNEAGDAGDHAPAAASAPGAGR